MLCWHFPVLYNIGSHLPFIYHLLTNFRAFGLNLSLQRGRHSCAHLKKARLVCYLITWPPKRHGRSLTDVEWLLTILLIPVGDTQYLWAGDVYVSLVMQEWLNTPCPPLTLYTFTGFPANSQIHLGIWDSIVKSHSGSKPAKPGREDGFWLLWSKNSASGSRKSGVFIGTNCSISNRSIDPSVNQSIACQNAIREQLIKIIKYNTMLFKYNTTQRKIKKEKRHGLTDSRPSSRPAKMKFYIVDGIVC